MVVLQQLIQDQIKKWKQTDTKLDSAIKVFKLYTLRQCIEREILIPQEESGCPRFLIMLLCRATASPKS